MFFVLKIIFLRKKIFLIFLLVQKNFFEKKKLFFRKNITPNLGHQYTRFGSPLHPIWVAITTNSGHHYIQFGLPLHPIWVFGFIYATHPDHHSGGGGGGEQISKASRTNKQTDRQRQLLEYKYRYIYIYIYILEGWNDGLRPPTLFFGNFLPLPIS